MSSRRLPAVVGLLVLVLGVVVVLLAGSTDRRPVAPVRANLPRTLPGDSPLTADVSRAPVGRALALHGRAVLVGTDGRSVRTVSEALRGSARGVDDPAPSLLSPDGTTVAAGTGAGASLALVDLATGTTGTVTTGTVAVPNPGSSLVPLAWSADGTQLALLVPATAPDTTGATVGRVVVADVGARQTHEVPGTEGAVAAAWAPDGDLLAVQVGSSLRLVDPATGTGVDLGVPTGRTLAGGQAWSPDGSSLTLTDGAGRWEFLPVVPGATVPAPVEAAGDVLGWLSAEEVLHLVAGTGSGGAVEVARTNLASGTSSTWTTVPASEGSVALATGLVADAVAVPGGGADQGPWPMPVRLVLVLLGAVLAVPATVGLQRRLRSVRQVVAVPEWARDSTPG